MLQDLKWLPPSPNDRIEMLNSYIPYLPGLVDSPQGANMKRAEALTEPELAQLLL